jgi:POT family proton-dependent oligopeptide transporter
MASAAAPGPQKTLFGHPTGLFVLFFAEMWERFSYYGMRALLVFYMIKGFLSYDDDQAYTVYGAYTALVYMTPFFGGMIADRLIGPRRAVVLGGLLMAAGHLVMGSDPGLLTTWFGMSEAAIASAGLDRVGEMAFFTALALLIVGNGMFKPNISTMVGDLYGEGDPRRDSGFTLFYMGINLGAAMAPLLCGYIGETYGWHYGFGLATVGMLVGLGIFVIPGAISKWIVTIGAVVTAVAMVALQDNWLLLLVNGFVGLALAVAGVIAFVAMTREPLAGDIGDPKSFETMRKPLVGPITVEWAVYIGAVLVVPVAAGLVYMNLTVQIIPTETLEALAHSESMITQLSGTLLEEISRPAGLILSIIGIGAVAYLLFEAFRSKPIERDRLFVILVLMFFSMLFWAFFEQAGSSVNNFTDRNVDRVFETQVVTAADVGKDLPITLTQEQLGYVRDGVMFSMDKLDKAREAGALAVTWKVEPEHVGMGLAKTEVPASTFLSANPIYILVFGLIFTALWNFLGRRNLDPSTPVKFALGLLQLGLGFGALWYGASMADERGMVAMVWLLLGYLLHTTGELCLSPVGLSMVTKLSPAKLVSTAMGAWFLATAFSNYLAAIIASFTGVGHGGGEEQVIPPPIETVQIYGGVFGQIAIAAIISAAVLFLMSPLLNYWMHEGKFVDPDAGDGGPDAPEPDAA